MEGFRGPRAGRVPGIYNQNVKPDTVMRRIRIPDARVVMHWGLTGVMAWFAFVLWSPKITMYGPIWQQFLVLGDEQIWAIYFSIATVLGAVGGVTKNKWIAMICTSALGTAHGTLALCFWMGGGADDFHTKPPGIGTYVFLAVFGYYLAIRKLATTLGNADERVLYIRVPDR